MSKSCRSVKFLIAKSIAVKTIGKIGVFVGSRVINGVEAAGPVGLWVGADAGARVVETGADASNNRAVGGAVGAANANITLDSELLDCYFEREDEVNPPCCEADYDHLRSGMPPVPFMVFLARSVTLLCTWPIASSSVGRSKQASFGLARQ